MFIRGLWMIRLMRVIRSGVTVSWSRAVECFRTFWPKNEFLALVCILLGCVSISDPSVFLWALKPAEEGISQGIVARFWNLSKTPIPASMTMWEPLSSARRTTHIETDIEEAIVTRGALVASFVPYQLQTFRLRPHSSAHSQRMQR
jgi:hypothetical protein